MSIKSVNWSIGRAAISTVPSQSGTLTYNGSWQSPTWANYDANQLAIGGASSGLNAGSYTATFTPKSNYCWSDGSTGAKNVNWSIERKEVAYPYVSSISFTYDGTSHSPSVVWDSSALTMTGTSSATNAGEYTMWLTPTSNYCWEWTRYTNAYNVEWSIEKATPRIIVSSYTASNSACYTNHDSWDVGNVWIDLYRNERLNLTLSNPASSYTSLAFDTTLWGRAVPKIPSNISLNGSGTGYLYGYTLYNTNQTTPSCKITWSGNNVTIENNSTMDLSHDNGAVAYDDVCLVYRLTTSNPNYVNDVTYTTNTSWCRYVSSIGSGGYKLIVVSNAGDYGSLKVRIYYSWR